MLFFTYSCMSSASWFALSLSHTDYVVLKMAPLEMLLLKGTSLMPPISNLISIFAICTVMKINHIRAQKQYLAYYPLSFTCGSNIVKRSTYITYTPICSSFSFPLSTYMKLEATCLKSEHESHILRCKIFNPVTHKLFGIIFRGTQNVSRPVPCQSILQSTLPLHHVKPTCTSFVAAQCLHCLQPCTYRSCFIFSTTSSVYQNRCHFCSSIEL